MPSLPSRQETLALLGGDRDLKHHLHQHQHQQQERKEQEQEQEKGGLGMGLGAWLQRVWGRVGARAAGRLAEGRGPALKFASRLNSMKQAASAAGGGDRGGQRVLDLLELQAKVRGLTHVHLNYPQHFEGERGASPDEVTAALRRLKLAPGAVCMRFPLGDFARGALTNPSHEVRKKAVSLTVEACRVARQIGAGEVVVWPQADGYDYYFQVDYQSAWDRAVDAYREIADACGGDLKVSLEWKPTDPVSRFAVVGSTAATLLLAEEVGRANFGVTLDLGHALMAGENPAQSVAMAARAGRLFGIQLGDA